jgi:hypothetical protein
VFRTVQGHTVERIESVDRTYRQRGQTFRERGQNVSRAWTELIESVDRTYRERGQNVSRAWTERWNVRGFVHGGGQCPTLQVTLLMFC